MDDFLETIRSEFPRLKAYGERALAQVTDADLHKTLDAESNSLAILVQHIGGNLHSRFSSFLTTDGEKPDRNRDDEFVAYESKTRRELMEQWERGWGTLEATLKGLTQADVVKTVTIRGEAHTVSQALVRSFAHISSHVGQVVYLSKHLASDRWSTLSVPRGKSREAPGTYHKKA